MTQIVDPNELTEAERRALVWIDSRFMYRVRNGYRNGNVNVNLKMVARLEAKRLVRQQVIKARETVVTTGAGRLTIGVLEQRRQQKEMQQ